MHVWSFALDLPLLSSLSPVAFSLCISTLRGYAIFIVDSLFDMPFANRLPNREISLLSLLLSSLLLLLLWTLFFGRHKTKRAAYKRWQWVKIFKYIRDALLAYSACICVPIGCGSGISLYVNFVGKVRDHRHHDDNELPKQKRNGIVIISTAAAVAVVVVFVIVFIVVDRFVCRADVNFKLNSTCILFLSFDIVNPCDITHTHTNHTALVYGSTKAHESEAHSHDYLI